MAKTSKFEKVLLDELEKFLGFEIKRQFVLPQTNMVFDGFIEKFKILIEIDGAYWHKGTDSMLRDARKDQAALIQGYNIFRIKELDYKKNKELICNRLKTRCSQTPAGL